MNLLQNKKEFVYYTLTVGAGFVFSYLINKFIFFYDYHQHYTSQNPATTTDDLVTLRGLLETNQIENKASLVRNHKKDLIDTENEEILIREQLKRNYEFFDEEKMQKIKNCSVTVIGIGGVGSHAIMTLIRSGVRNIRVIDYDMITLSSLNRHAFAVRKDVGKMKVKFK